MMITPEIVETKARVVHASVGPKPEFVKILDWEGKSLTFMLADEIRAPEAKEKGQVSLFNRLGF
jgi:hypothetical protein